MVVIVDTKAAYTYWNPRTSTTSYDLSASVQSVVVSGPYLVRTATITSSTLALVGDLDGPTTLTVFAPAAVTSITWNGAKLKISKSALGVGLSATLNNQTPSFNVPKLSTLTWNAIDSFPEVSPSFDDSKWVVGNKTSTARKYQPGSGKYMLYADEYGTFELITQIAATFLMF